MGGKRVGPVAIWALSVAFGLVAGFLASVVMEVCR